MTQRRQDQIREAPATIHEILVSWQEGRLSARHAIAACGLGGFDELYQAARDSGVPLRKTLLPEERRAADFATAAVREALVGTRGEEQT